MAQILEAIAILLIVWQLMIRLRKNVRISSDAKNQLKEAIEDAKDRLPSTGLFKLFKQDRESLKNGQQFEVKIEQTIVPANVGQNEDTSDKK